MLKKYFALVGLILLFGCNSKHDESIVFEFSATRPENWISYINVQKELEIAWEADILVIKKEIFTQGGDEILGGDYEITDNKITLKYIFLPCNSSNCLDLQIPQELIFRFSGLEQKDYEFELERVEKFRLFSGILDRKMSSFARF